MIDDVPGELVLLGTQRGTRLGNAIGERILFRQMKNLRLIKLPAEKISSSTAYTEPSGLSSLFSKCSCIAGEGVQRRPSPDRGQDPPGVRGWLPDNDEPALAPIGA
ncbi:MAG: hypothetical protein K9L28_07305, partial [Synergistales bacterium]|nr:hypothetical protein [Synergistales bacterium]